MKIQIKYLLFIFILLIGSITALNVQTTHADEIPGLQGWYNFDGDMLDSSGNNYHGTSASPPVLTKDINENLNSAYYFSTNDNISFGDNFNMENNDFSISFWFKAKELTGIDQLIGKTNDPYYIGSSGRGFFIGLREDSGVDKLVVQLRGNTGGSELRSDEIDETKWHFVALVKNATSYSVYLDDDPVRTSNTTLGNISSPGVDFVIGQDPSGINGYNGTIDEVKIYDNALNSGQITSIYEDGLPSNFPPEITSISGIPTQALNVEFNVEVTDPDSVNFTYLWDFGDQNNSTLKNPTHTYDAPGVYIIKITVTDDTNRTVEGSISVRVDSSGSSMIYAPSCSFDHVYAAVDLAISGDTVNIPAGNAIWDETLVISDDKKITIQGAGVGLTVISSDSDAPNPIINLKQSGSRVTAIEFWQYNDTGAGVLVDGTNWRIDHCKFENKITTGMKAIRAIGYDGVSPVGLIDHCEFISTRVLVEGDSSLMANDIWAEPLGLGTNNAVFIEDCTFVWTKFGNIVDANYGGRYVLRYNTITDAYIETHSLQGNHRATRSWEIYGNIIKQENMSVWTPFSLRGGTGVVFNNTLIGTWGMGAHITVDNRRTFEALGEGGLADGTSPWDGNEEPNGYPARDQIGRSTDQWLWTEANPYPPQELDPFYQWNNIHEGSAIDVYVHNNCGIHIKENRDYYNNVVKPGYTPYTYPHPLIKATESGSFNIMPAIQLLLLDQGD